MTIENEMLGNENNSNKSESLSQKSKSLSNSNRSATKSITKEEIEICSSSAKKINFKNRGSPLLEQEESGSNSSSKLKALEAEIAEAR